MPPSTADELYGKLLELSENQSYPPVASWHPDRTGEIDIRIDRDGTWHHEGTPIRRPELVRLFSTILRREPEGYFLVTPAEKLRIQVDDVPFVAIDAEQGSGKEGPELLFTTNVGDYVVADANHPIIVREHDGQHIPYLHVRDALEARLSRPLFYRLANLCELDADGYWLESRGARFRLG